MLIMFFRALHFHGSCITPDLHPALGSRLCKIFWAFCFIDLSAPRRAREPLRPFFTDPPTLSKDSPISFFSPQLVSGQDYDVADISCSFGRTTATGGAGAGGGGANGDGNADADPEGLTALLRHG